MPDGIEVYIPAPSTTTLDFVVDSSSERHFPRKIERGGCIGWMERLLPWLLCLPASIAFLGSGTDWYGASHQCEQLSEGPGSSLSATLARLERKNDDSAPMSENSVTYSHRSLDRIPVIFYILFTAVLIAHGIKLCRDNSHPADSRPSAPSSPPNGY